MRHPWRNKRGFLVFPHSVLRCLLPQFQSLEDADVHDGTPRRVAPASKAMSTAAMSWEAVRSLHRLWTLRATPSCVLCKHSSGLQT